MPYAIGNTASERLLNYIVVGSINGSDDTRQSVFSNTDDMNYAKQISMTWLVAGFVSWVTSMNFIMPTGMQGIPTQTFSFNNLASVQAIVPALTKYSYQMTPMVPPEGLSDDDFATWLVEQSNLPANYPPAVASTVPIVPQPVKIVLPISDEAQDA
jgi:hypothetical protein